MTIHISPKKQEMIQALPAETQQRLLDGQHSTLEQIVYETATQKLITIWAVDLCAEDTVYIFANEVRQLQAKEKIQ